jgi:hypothetical protein
MMHALAAVKDNVQDEEHMLDIVHHNTSPSTHLISVGTGQLSQRTAWHTVHENKLYPFNLQPVQVLQQGTYISI